MVCRLCGFRMKAESELNALILPSETEETPSAAAAAAAGPWLGRSTAPEASGPSSISH